MLHSPPRKVSSVGRSTGLGASFTVSNDRTDATILESRLAELKDMALSISSRNVVSVKELRTFTGKAQSIASLLYVWRPFVHMLYGAIQACAEGSAPPTGPNTRWVRQIRQPVDWILAFLTGRVGDLTRRISLDSYLRRGHLWEGA